MDWKRLHRWVRIIWVTGGLTFVAWMVWNMQAHGVNDRDRRSSPSVSTVVGDGAMIFMPTGAAADRPALVFLPGGMVDPDAYVPLVRAIADAGWPTAIVTLPWRMAFSESANADVWRRVELVRGVWGRGRPIALGGHSRGAAMSTRFAAVHAGELAGLFLIGTTHPRDNDLSSFAGPVLKISGTRDCVAEVADSLSNKGRLPAHTTWLTIDGANHAQFGYYGQQLGDCGATIDRADQQRRTREALVSWLAGVS